MFSFQKFLLLPERPNVLATHSFNCCSWNDSFTLNTVEKTSDTHPSLNNQSNAQSTASSLLPHRHRCPSLKTTAVLRHSAKMFPILSERISQGSHLHRLNHCFCFIQDGPRCFQSQVHDPQELWLLHRGPGSLCARWCRVNHWRKRPTRLGGWVVALDS